MSITTRPLDVVLHLDYVSCEDDDDNGWSTTEIEREVRDFVLGLIRKTSGLELESVETIEFDTQRKAQP